MLGNVHLTQRLFSLNFTLSELAKDPGHLRQNR
ncbi:MAG: hypothetical protein RL071_1375, partial [Pseudomonadota bacterium]